jgi:RimJ/RimL family protein N-acetyltransferase
MGQRLEFFDDPAAFLETAGDHLARSSVLNTVVATIAMREAREGRQRPPGVPHWYLAALSGDGVVEGAAMRTAAFEPFPLFVLPMPEQVALELAHTLHARGESVGGVNGALPAARLVADESARLAGRTSRLAVHTRLFELHEVVPPPAPAGALRVARESDVDLVLRWYRAFHREADEQAGRVPATTADPAVSREELLTRIRLGCVFVWEVDGEPVHLCVANPPSYGVARIGPVFTPAAHRGRGYSGAAVALVSQRLLDQGATPCLFTDQANPVSNRIYQRLGYQAVADMVNLLVE